MRRETIHLCQLNKEKPKTEKLMKKLVIMAIILCAATLNANPLDRGAYGRKSAITKTPGGSPVQQKSGDNIGEAQGTGKTKEESMVNALAAFNNKENGKPKSIISQFTTGSAGSYVTIVSYRF